MRHVPEIKLIRTDTTLDLSQKAEKVCFIPIFASIYSYLHTTWVSVICSTYICIYIIKKIKIYHTGAFHIAHSSSVYKNGSDGIRTHASEETRTWVERLRPLGHWTWSWLVSGNSSLLYDQCEHTNFYYQKTKKKVLPGFEPGLLDSKSRVITITL